MLLQDVAASKSFGIGLSFGDLPKTFAENFRALQDRSGLTGRAIAQSAGISEPEISEYRTGSGGTPELARLLRLATAMRCTVEELVDGIDSQYDAARDLVRQNRDQQSGSSSHVGDSNDPVAARVLRLQEENSTLRTALEKITHVASELVQIAKAGVEVNSAIDEGSGGGDRD